VDFVVPARARVPVPSFCVERGRWHRRANEETGAFSSAKHYLSSKGLKVASRLRRDQQAVWGEVAEAQGKLASAVDAKVADDVSPSGYELTLDHAKVRDRRAAYVTALATIVDVRPDTVGFLFAVNGQINSAEVYASAGLFRKYWRKLLESAAVEAVAELPAEPVTVTPPGLAVVAEFLKATSRAAGREQKITERVTLKTRRRGGDVLFETHDTAHPAAAVHRSYLHVV
jgi:hypothetical protein